MVSFKQDLGGSLPTVYHLWSGAGFLSAICCCTAKSALASCKGVEKGETNCSHEHTLNEVRNRHTHHHRDLMPVVLLFWD
jgi:hypothetical protein